MDAECEEDAIKLLTDGHSDLTFLGWPSEIPYLIKVYSETRYRRATNNREKIKKAKYRHLVCEDKLDSLPFSVKNI